MLSCSFNRSAGFWQLGCRKSVILSFQTWLELTFVCCSDLAQIELALMSPVMKESVNVFIDMNIWWHLAHYGAYLINFLSFSVQAFKLPSCDYGSCLQISFGYFLLLSCYCKIRNDNLCLTNSCNKVYPTYNFQTGTLRENWNYPKLSNHWASN